MSRLRVLSVLVILTGLVFTACETTEFDSRNNFRGTWNVEEYSYRLPMPSYYQSRITLDEFNEENIFIDNFYDAGLEISAMVVGSKMFIPYQQIGIFEILDGYGGFSENTISMSYVVRITISEDQVITDTLEAYFTKRY
ncbi:MAG: hypothetical protein K0B37_01435 [Bacteroidales bacterium]|nr:hypothetical protein [Bacteroidales bacterium]